MGNQLEILGERHQEVKHLVAENELGRAIRRLMDLASDYSDKQTQNEAIGYSSTFKRLQAQRRRLGPSSDLELQLNTLIQSVLATADFIEAETASPYAEDSNEIPLDSKPKAAQTRNVRPSETDVGGPAPGDEPPLTRLEEAQRRHREGAAPVEKECEVLTVACRCGNLGKKYRGSHAFSLSNISFNLVPGEITGVVGANGSGKTTLLRIVAGDLSLSTGSVEYPSLNPKAAVNWGKIRSQIAFVRQRTYRWYGLLEDNIRLAAALGGAMGRENDHLVEFFLHRLGLDEFRNSRWHEISGGFQMRFEVARALVSRPKLLILDEPLAPFDINTQQLFLQDLRDLSRSVRAPLPVLITSQHLYEIESVADRLIFLKGGKPVYCGLVKNIGADRKENLYEIACGAEREELYCLFESLGVDTIDDVGGGYLIHAPIEVHLKEVVNKLHTNDIKIIYFRDVSRSSRSLFPPMEAL